MQLIVCYVGLLCGMCRCGINKRGLHTVLEEKKQLRGINCLQNLVRIYCLLKEESLIKL